MTYIEIAVSDGPGTLVNHCALHAYGVSDMLGTIENEDAMGNGVEPSVQTLTESEYQDFIGMHGGTVAV